MNRTLLIVHPGSIGDVLVARQALEALRLTYPDHALGLIVRQDAGALLEACGEANRTFPLEGASLTGLLAGPESTPSALREWLRKCDLAVCWMSEPGSLRATLQRLGVNQTVFHPASRALVEIHQADYLLQTVRSYTRATPSAGPLQLPPFIKEQGRAILHGLGVEGSRLAVIHPGSGSPHKCVAAETLAAVVNGLDQRGIQVLLAEGPADDVQIRKVRELCITMPPAVSGRQLAIVAGVLSHAALFVGNDSGLTHLAAALAVPTLALFGPTDRTRWAPRGSGVTVLCGSPCRCEGWDMIRACSDKPCLRIASDQILAACDQRLLASADVNGDSHAL